MMRVRHHILVLKQNRRVLFRQTEAGYINLFSLKIGHAGWKLYLSILF